MVLVTMALVTMALFTWGRTASVERVTPLLSEHFKWIFHINPHAL